MYIFYITFLPDLIGKNLKRYKGVHIPGVRSKTCENKTVKNNRCLMQLCSVVTSSAFACDCGVI